MKDNQNKQFYLSEEERIRMKEVLREYVAMTPIRDAGIRDVRTTAKVPTVFSWFTFHARPIIASSLIAIFALSGVSYAAEDALPGDSLYSVKVKVNEEARLLFTFGDEAVAKWETRRAERRLEEAIALARNSKNIPEAVFASLAVDIDIFASRASEKIAKLREERPEAADAIGTQFAQALVKGSEELIAIESSIIEEGAVLALNKAVDTQPLSIEGSTDVSAKASTKISASVGTEMAMLAVPTTPLTPVIDTVQSRIAGIPLSVTAVTPVSEPLIVTHTYKDGVHTYSGVVVGATCESLIGEGLVKELSDNEEVFITLTLDQVEASCGKAEDKKEFSVVLQAGQKASLVSITKDGEPLVFELEEKEITVEAVNNEDGESATTTEQVSPL